MIIAGISCKHCGGLVLDNLELTACHRCNEPYEQSILDLIKIHHKAKMDLVAQNISDPEEIAQGVIALAESSIVAANLYTD
jgi:hypothetical protein